MDALKLDHVLFVPVADHPFKGETTRTGIDSRLEMLKLAIENNERFSISRVDIERAGPHYSADTVRLIQEQHPQDLLYFVMGGDNLRSLPKWTRADDLYKSCRIAVMRRADEDISVTMHDHILPNLSEKLDIVDVPLLSVWVSSTHIIDRLTQGLSVRYLVPDTVLDYVKEHGLYQNL